MLNNGSGFFPSSLQHNLTQQFGSVHAVGIGDVNGDHYGDIVAGMSNSYACVFLGSSTGAFTVKGTYSIAAFANQLQLVNMFKLSSPQIVAWDSGDFTTTIGYGDGSFRAPDYQWVESAHYPYGGNDPFTYQSQTFCSYC